MEWLNYHHLLYFWVVAREGGLTPASAELHLAESTISGQIRALEDAVGEKLFRRSGRRLVLTEVGRVAFRYADEIFTLGKECLDAIKGGAGGRPTRLVVGVADALPKTIVRRLLEPSLHLVEPVRIICREDRSGEEFMAELAMFRVDLVLADLPMPPTIPIRAFSHLLGECGTTFFAAPRIAEKYRRRFPHSLDGAPFLMPGMNCALRRALDQWFHSENLHPQIIGEFDDAALTNVFGGDGIGVFAGPTVIEADMKRHVRVVGRVEDLLQRFYAISAERKLKHPAVVAICDTARERLFR